MPSAPAAAHEGVVVHCDATVCLWYHQTTYNGGGCALGEDSHNELSVDASVTVAGETVSLRPFATCHETHGYGRSGVGLQVVRHGPSGFSFQQVSWTGWSDEASGDHYCGITVMSSATPATGFIGQTVACPDGVRPPVATIPVLPGSEPYN